MSGPKAEWTTADSDHLRTVLADLRQDFAAIQADMTAINARIGRVPTPMGWMALRVAYVPFVSVVFGIVP